MTHFKTFPFTAIVGQDRMKLALILNAINPKIGGVLIKGPKGTAKSTAVRALADVLPKIRVVMNCPFNCNPDLDKEACHQCQQRIHEGNLDENEVKSCEMRVINLPINASEDRVVGTVDIKKALSEGIRALEPGILADANRNILYIDEVNLLADNVADVLLDAAAMGINIIEREGISIHHPSNFILVGTMNPEEGNLRPQLLDRFGLSVGVDKITNVEQRVEIIKRTEAYLQAPHEFHDSYQEKQEELRERITNASELLPRVTISDELLEKIAEVCIEFETDGHRADITINITAKTIAAFHGRESVELEDIKSASRLALPHRMHRLPFEDDTLDEKKLEELLQDDTDEQHQKQEEHQEPANLDENKGDQAEEEDLDQPEKGNPASNAIPEMVFGIDTSVKVPNVAPRKRIKETLASTGKVVSHPTSDSRGRYVRSAKRPSINIPRTNDIAISPTINDAAFNTIPSNSSTTMEGRKINVTDKNIHLKIRDGKSSYLVIFCVDASGSMGVERRMEMVKGAVFSILQDNYINRDKVAMVTFRNEGASLLLPPTRSTELAHKMLKEIPTGGTTPLAAGLIKVLDLVREERRKKSGYLPLVILLTDARGNVWLKDAIEDIEKIGNQFAKESIPAIIIDTESTDVNLGLSKKLAKAAGARYHHIDYLEHDTLEQLLVQEGVMHVPGE